MIVNLNLKNKRGQDLYKNVLTGTINSLSQQVFQPSIRKEKRLYSGQTKQVASSTKVATFTESSKKHWFAFRTNRYKPIIPVEILLKLKHLQISKYLNPHNPRN